MAAIHVYEQLQLLWKDDNWADLPLQRKRRRLSIDLLKATARAKLNTWQSTHEAIYDFIALYKKLQPEYAKMQSDSSLRSNDKKFNMELAAYNELLAHTYVQLAYTDSLYLSYIYHYMVADIFRHPSVPKDLKVSEADEKELRKKNGNPKPIIIDTINKIKNHYEEFINKARKGAEDSDIKWIDLVDFNRRKAEFVSRLRLTSGYANYQMAEFENSLSSGENPILGETFDTRLKEAEKDLRGAEATHPNHYVTLQLLGLVYSEPRRKGEFTDLSIAEKYFERAIIANPSDYYGHELLADLLYRRAANGGVDMLDRATIERGIGEAKRATVLREFSGTSYLLQAEFQTMLLSIERDPTMRRELRKGLKQYLDQAKRYLPRTYEANFDLIWVSIVADTLQLDDDTLSRSVTQASPDSQNLFEQSKKDVIEKIDELIDFCIDFEQKWVAHQRVFEVERLGERARLLKTEIEKATRADWREIHIPFR